MSLRRALFAVAAVAALAAPACTRKESLDPSTMPESVRPDYAVFARRCSKCHTLARPLNANITDDEQWVHYVARMRHQPGSGITETDEAIILRFLRYYAAELRRQEAQKNPVAPAPGSDGGIP